MNTPERAVELANQLEVAASEARQAARMLVRKAGRYYVGLAGVYLADARANEEHAAILRHYAEIMQAEPVAEIGKGVAGQLKVLPYDWGDVSYGDRLIIKPKPIDGCGACQNSCKVGECRVAAESPKYEQCGGCGNYDPAKRCIGCRHSF